VISVSALYLLILTAVFAALNTIFRAGTYVYATAGQAPTLMDPSLLASAFRSKK